VNLYVDSSALAKRYLSEVGTETLLGLIKQAESVVASRLTWLELTSVVARRARQQALPFAEEVFRSLDEDFSILIEIVELKHSVMSDARLIAKRHALRGGDSIQLASAKDARTNYGAELRFVASDRRLLDAAQAEGFTVLDPTD